MADGGTHGLESAGVPDAEPVVPVLITTTGGGLVRVDMPDPEITLSAERARQVARALLTAADSAEQSTEKPSRDQETAAAAAGAPGGMPTPAEITTSITPAPPSPAPAATAEDETSQEGVPAHPATPGVTFSVKTRCFMADEGLNPYRIAEVVTSPDDTWQSTNPGADNPEVAVADWYPWGAVYYPDDQDQQDGVYVIGVYPVSDLYRRRRMQSTGQPRAKSGGDKRPAIENLDDLITAANQAGLEYQRTAGGHGRITDPNHPENGFVSIPTTPSDHRSWDNVLAEIRRRLHATL